MANNSQVEAATRGEFGQALWEVLRRAGEASPWYQEFGQAHRAQRPKLYGL